MISLTCGKDNLNRPKLTWTDSTNKDHTYQAFRKRVAYTNGDATNIGDFEPIQAFNVEDELNLGKGIKVLHIYQASGESDFFQTYMGDTVSYDTGRSIYKWIKEFTPLSKTGVGLGKVEVSSTTFDEFLFNPLDTLFVSGDIPKYDVICMGFSENVIEAELTEESLSYIKEAINQKVGFIISSDFISGDVGTTGQMSELRNLFDIRIGAWYNTSKGADLQVGASFEGNKIEVSKSSEISFYPWKIGSIGEVFDIKETSTASQFAYGYKWFSLHSPTLTPVGNLTSFFLERGNFYVTAKDHCAMLMTGKHKNITDTEKKILVNTIFHVNQRTKKMEIVDVSGVDDAPPSTPQITNYIIDVYDKTVKFSVDALDIGTMFEYYVTATERLSEITLKSNVVTGKSVSEVDKYFYKMHLMGEDKEYETTTSKEITITEVESGNYIFKVYCQDRTNNISKVKEMLLYVPRVEEIEIKKTKRVPNMQRVNNRYRGPHESIKISDFYMQCYKNVSDLQAEFNYIDTRYKEVCVQGNVQNVNFIHLNNTVRDQIKNKKSRKYLIQNECF